MVPISTASDRIFGGTTRTSVQSIYVEATSGDTLSAAYQEANQELLQRLLRDLGQAPQLSHHQIHHVVGKSLGPNLTQVPRSLAHYRYGSTRRGKATHLVLLSSRKKLL